MNALRMLFALLAVPLLALTGPGSVAQIVDLPITVSEAATRLKVDGDTLDLSFAVVNTNTVDIPVRIELAFLRPEGDVVKSESSRTVLKPRTNVRNFHIRQFLSDSAPKDRENLPWLRLSYQIVREDAPSIGPVSGVISFSGIMDILRVRIAQPSSVVAGDRFQALVFTETATAGIPIGGADIEAALTKQDRSGTTVLQRARARTDANGVAVLSFQAPAGLEETGGMFVTVTATAQGQVRSASMFVGSVNPADASEVIVTTDKPIYQPGQVLHMRILALSSGQASLAGRTFSIEVENPEDSDAVFKKVVTTSRYGEADADWTIPEDALSGSYAISVRDPDDATVGQGLVRVASYDLPVFSIRTKSDRPFYLVNQPAEVEVETRYLFGQPVAGARVRVVESRTNRDSESDAVAEGLADAAGKFVVHISPGVARNQADLRDRQFIDREYSVYVTDPVSGRSEERRVMLRVTRDPIHVHVDGIHRLGSVGPVSFYVVTQSADGTPVSCTVEMQANDGGSLMAAGRTDRFGVARIQAPWPNSGEFVLTAEDANGSRGRASMQLEEPLGTDVEVDTDKIAYAEGDPLRIEVRSIHPSGMVVLDVASGGQLLDTKIAQLEGGRASVTFPYSSRLQGSVMVVARYTGDRFEDEDVYRAGQFDDLKRRILEGESSGYRRVRRSTPRSAARPLVRAVSYPLRPRLEVQAIPEKDTYAPGEEARIRFRVAQSDGQAGPSLLGIVVRDRAVDERATAGVDGPATGDIQTIIRNELDRVDRRRPLPESLRTAVEWLMASEGAGAADVGSRRMSESELNRPESLFRPSIDRQLEPFMDAFRTSSGRPLPQSRKALRELMVETGTEALKDPWGTPYGLELRPVGYRMELSLWAAGPDHEPRTEDDFVAASVSWGVLANYRNAINRAVLAYHERTGGYVGDMNALRGALRAAGEDVDVWQDFWGRPLVFRFRSERVSRSTNGSPQSVRFTIEARVSGPGDTDTYSVWNQQDFSGDWMRKIVDAMTQYRFRQKTVPSNGPEFDEVLRQAGIDGLHRADGWGRPYYVRFENLGKYPDVVEMSVRNRLFTTETPYDVYTGGLDSGRADAELQRMSIWSLGADGVESQD
ncbi:MAG TPA: MG2 domain-containing protein, partial [Terriglobia bacterium]|nr:MG2 domain-containing protein [Terriglobia bacterium]